MIRATKIVNTSNEDVSVVLATGAKVQLPPGGELRNVDIVNESAVRGKCKLVENLSEVG